MKIHKVTVISHNEPVKVIPKLFGQVTVFGEGTRDYELLENKPRINDTTLVGNKTSKEIGIGSISNMEILNLFK